MDNFDLRKYLSEGRLLKDSYINDEGELEDFSLEDENNPSSKSQLKSLGFDVEKVDPNEKLYYLELPDNGGRSVTSKDKYNILDLKDEYPKKWGKAILKYDTKWHHKNRPEENNMERGPLKDFVSKNKEEIVGKTHLSQSEEELVISIESNYVVIEDEEEEDRIYILDYEPTEEEIKAEFGFGEFKPLKIQGKIIYIIEV